MERRKKILIDRKDRGNDVAPNGNLPMPGYSAAEGIACGLATKPSATASCLPLGTAPVLPLLTEPFPMTHLGQSSVSSFMKELDGTDKSGLVGLRQFPGMPAASVAMAGTSATRQKERVRPWETVGKSGLRGESRLVGLCRQWQSLGKSID